MQKIVLSERTMGVIMGRLHTLFSKPILCQNQFDQNPLRAKGWGKFENRTRLKAVVTRHPFSRLPPARMFGTPNMFRPQPLIHVQFSQSSAAVYHPGDVFYFLGGAELIVDQQGDLLKSHDRGLDRFIRVRLSEPDVKAVVRENHFEKQYADEYWASVAREAEREMEEDMLAELLDGSGEPDLIH